MSRIKYGVPGEGGFTRSGDSVLYGVLEGGPLRGEMSLRARESA